MDNRVIEAAGAIVSRAANPSGQSLTLESFAKTVEKMMQDDAEWWRTRSEEQRAEGLARLRANGYATDESDSCC